MGDIGINPTTLALIKHFEGYTPTPKWDNKQYSVGYSTKWEPGTPVGTKADHEAALAREAGSADQWLNKNVTVPMTDRQRAALTSWGYNTGALDNLKDDINSGDWNKVAQHMMQYTRAGDKPDALRSRREDEVAFMLDGRDPTGGKLAPTQTAAPAVKDEKGNDMGGLMAMLAGGGLNMGGLSGTAIPPMASAADPNSLQGLFGSLGANVGQGQGQGGGQGDNLKLATEAMNSAAKDDPDAAPKLARKPFDMQQLASMLSKSGYLGTARPQTPGGMV